MSYTEARSHFEKAKLDNPNKGMLDLLDGLKHLSHALEEDFRNVEQSVRNIRDVQSSKQYRALFRTGRKDKLGRSSTTRRRVYRQRPSSLQGKCQSNDTVDRLTPKPGLHNFVVRDRAVRFGCGWCRHECQFFAANGSAAGLAELPR